MALSWQAYLNSIEREGKSPHTVTAFDGDLRQFAAWLAENRVGDLASIRRQHVVDWLSTFEGMSTSTRKRKLTSVRGWLAFEAARGKIKASPAADVEGPRRIRPLPQVLTLDQVERMLSASQGSSPEERRSHALIDLIYSTGARVGEASYLLDDHVHLEAGHIVVKGGKGEKDRLLPFGRLTKASLRRWLESRAEWLGANAKRNRHRGAPFFFRNFRDGGRLTERSIQRTVQVIGTRCGLSGVTPHTLRHSCASHMLERGASLLDVQEMLGHSDIESTRIYASVAPIRLRSTHRATHPRG